MSRFFRQKKRILILILALLVILMSIPVTLLFLISENDSLLLLQKNNMDTTAAHNVRKLARTIRNGVFSGKKEVSLKVSQTEFNQLVALARHSNPRINGRINVSMQGIYFVFSLYVPENPAGDYLNISFMVLPSTNGLVIDEVKVGRLGFSGNSARWLSEWAMNLVLGKSLGSEILDSVKQVAINGKNALVQYQPVVNLSEKLKHSRKRFREFRKDLQFGGDPKLVGVYLRGICQFDKTLNHDQQRSLVMYLPTVFNLVAAQDPDQKNIRNQYKAAILAVGVYFGSRQFESVIGHVLTGDLKSCVSDSGVTLAGRNDLVRHFAVSAGLQVLAVSKESFAIGEFKELLDSDKGGSGFSFIDLAADRAGLRFTIRVLKNSGHWPASKFIALLKDESAIMPSIVGLKEDLSKREFDLFYQDVDSVAYKSILKDIEQRIDRLSFFR